MDFDEFDDWDDAVVIGSFFNEMIEEELEEERKKKRKLDPDYGSIFNPDDDEPYP